MASNPKSSAMKTISFAEWSKTNAKEGGAAPALLPSSSLPSKPTLPITHKRSATDPVSSLSSSDAAVISRAIEDLKQAQELTNGWFNRITSLSNTFELPAINGSLASSTALAEQLTAFARETTWLEQEAARVEAENYELDQQIQTLRHSIEESRELLSRASEQEITPSGPISPILLLIVSVTAFAFLFILLLDSVFRKDSRLPYRFS